MKKRKLYFFKIFMSILFASAILAAFVYVCIKGDLEHNILSLSCIGACFLLSLFFIRCSSKKVLFTFALALNAAADCLFVLLPSENSVFLNVCLMAGVQALYLLYTLFMIKGNGLRVFSLALRVALCLLAYYLLPKYFVLTTIQLIHAMIVINSFVTLLSFLFFFKTQWVTFLGFLLFFAFNFISALGAGWAIILNLPVKFLEFLINPFLMTPGLAFVFYIPAVLILSLSSVWAIGEESYEKVAKPAKVAKVAKVSKNHGVAATTTAPRQAGAINRPSSTDGMSTISLDDL